MKSFVITITHMEKSIDVAKRCIKSASNFGTYVEMFSAITPRDDLLKLGQEINLSNFDETYSRKENAIACFLSHYTLWKRCVDLNDDILILEHDAVFVSPLPKQISFDMLVSLGKPSYGKYRIPSPGIGTLVSKEYLPGAHAYVLKPKAAEQLINKSKIKASPVDVFINKKDFPWVQEFYPWPIEVYDSFTTVQKEKGCIAKHNYKEGFEII